MSASGIELQPKLARVNEAVIPVDSDSGEHGDGDSG